MAGKLNGVMPAQTPMGWRVVSLSTLARDVRQRRAHQKAGHAAGELDDFYTALARSRVIRPESCRARA